MLQNSFFLTEACNPDLPAEVWTLVYTATPGSFGYSAGWGKYRIEYSGGGGSGSSVALRKTGSISSLSQKNGSAGQLIKTNINVLKDTTTYISGYVGAGGKGSYTYASTGSTVITLGNPGTGYSAGSKGTQASFRVMNNSLDTGYGAMAGGSGGGSTRVLANGSVLGIAKGGNGGRASLYNSFNNDAQPAQTFSVSGGTGGSGGVSNGTGAAGGAASYGAGSDDANTSGNGKDGYVRIYKSNLKPESN